MGAVGAGPIAHAGLTAVQWGLLSLFGVVVTLLIPHADQNYKAFLLSGTDEDREVAVLWEWRIKGTALLVLVALGLLSVLGAYDAGLLFMVPRTSAISSGSRWLGVLVVDTGRPRSGVPAWLLVTPLLAQVAFLYLVVFGLVRRVPPVVPLPLESPEAMQPSAPGQNPPTVIRFVNETPADVSVDWINLHGTTQPYPPVPAGQGRSQLTFVGHRFRLRRADGQALHTVTAAANPGKVVIE
jgi:hypothetical protein